MVTPGDGTDGMRGIHGLDIMRFMIHGMVLVLDAGAGETPTIVVITMASITDIIVVCIITIETIPEETWWLAPEAAPGAVLFPIAQEPIPPQGIV